MFHKTDAFLSKEQIATKAVSKKEAAATDIQKYLRGFWARRQYTINHLNKDQLETYLPFLIGNDSPLKSEDVAKYAFDTNFLFVGTSVMRSLELACTLAQNKNTKIFPKIVILDNSREVCELWRGIKAFFADSKHESLHDLVSGQGKNFMKFLFDESTFRTEKTGNILSFLRQLFFPYSLDEMKKIIANIIIIEQSWEDVQTLKTLKKIYHDRPIVAYPSNIITFVQDKARQAKIMEAIACLAPNLMLCTDSSGLFGTPSKAFILKQPNAIDISTSLKLDLDDKEQELEPSFKSFKYC